MCRRERERVGVGGEGLVCLAVGSGRTPLPSGCDTWQVCSNYSPITWQVDRECHLISASSFDKMCYDMLQQGDDMSDDIYPHGARELVVDPDLISPQV